jgi:hypothetical protein
VSVPVATTPFEVRVLCPHCSCLDVPSGLALEDGEIHASCGRCERPFSLGVMRGLRSTSPRLTLVAPRPSPPRPSPSPEPKKAWLPLDLTSVELEGPSTEAAVDAQEPFLVPEAHCPKCIAPRGAASSCARCGLVFAQADLALLQPPKWLVRRWAMTWNDWSNDAQHQVLLERALQQDALPALARLYRLRLAWAPGDVIAEAACAELVRRASFPLVTGARTDASVQRRRRFLFGLVGLASLLMAVAAWATRALH